MPYELSPAQRRKKNRLERWGIILAGAGLLALTLFQRGVISLGPDFSKSQSLAALVSINVSVLLTAVLLFLILRSLYRVFFERRELGSLQTKMVISFIALSLAPTLLIFYYSYRVVVSGHDLWFSSRLEEAIGDSVNLAEAVRRGEEGLDGRIENVRGALADYRDALKVERPFRATQLTALTAMTMLAIFLSIWTGARLARSLSRPLTYLVAGTRKVAAGDWDYVLKLPEGAGEFTDLVESFNGMTRDLKVLYTELERAQRVAAWREAARRVAHEVKNPLTPIQLATQRLQRRFGPRLAAEGDAAVFQECTEVIIRQVEEMKRLVDEFSRFARLPAITPVMGDFAAFVEETLALFRQAHKNINFVFAVRGAPPPAPFDREQMRRALANILDNAAAAMAGRGEVRLTLEATAAGTLKLTVADNGPGLDPAVAGRIFDPHVTTKAGGQGLGLSIVRAIMTDHGGSVAAASPPGGGAAFILELPCGIMGPPGIPPAERT